MLSVPLGGVLVNSLLEPASVSPEWGEEVTAAKSQESMGSYLASARRLRNRCLGVPICGGQRGRGLGCPLDETARCRCCLGISGPTEGAVHPLPGTPHPEHPKVRAPQGLTPVGSKGEIGGLAQQQKTELERSRTEVLGVIRFGCPAPSTRESDLCEERKTLLSPRLAELRTSSLQTP